ncbi:MAG: hypothetical protein ACQEXN_14515 [Actinomycetota bacterium]
MSPEEMSAFAAWIGAIAAVGTLIVACVAAGYAKKQIDKAEKAIAGSTLDAFRSRKLQRELQTEQAQPYVVAYLEADQIKPFLIDLVVKNLGSTMATGVTIGSFTDMKRSPRPPSTESNALGIPNEIPTLAPQQEWRTFWDASHLYKEEALPTEFTVTLKYGGIKGQRFHHQYRLDWKPFFIRHYTT